MCAVSSVRVALPSDLTRIREIIDLSFPRFFRLFASNSLESEDGQLLVAENEGVVAGFVKLLQFSIAKTRYGCIFWIAVHPTFRRKGVALNLTKVGVDFLKKDGAKSVFASTQRRNRAALDTLNKVGFIMINFLGLWRLLGWRVFSFYRKIWFAPNEIILIFKLV